MKFNRLLPYLIVFAHSFNDLHDPLIAAVGGILGILTVELIWFIGAIIWNLGLNKLIKSILIVGLVSAFGITFYTSTQYLSKYRYEKQLQKWFPEQQLKELKISYEEHKKMDFHRLTNETIDRIDKLCANDQTGIRELTDEIRRINEILDNIFISKDESKRLNEIRARLVKAVKQASENNNIDLKAFDRAEFLHEFIRKIEFDPIKIELSTILVEKGRTECIKYFATLYESAEGRIKIEKFLSLNYAELLEHYINDVAEFETFTISLLTDVPVKSASTLTDSDIQEFIRNRLPDLIKTIEGRNQVVKCVKKLYEVPMLSVSALFDILKENKGNVHQLGKVAIKQINERINTQVDKIIREFKSI